MQLSRETQLALSLINLNGKVQRKLAGALTVRGLGVTEYLVLLQLFNAPEQTLRRIDLAEKTGLTASGVTRVLNPMEKIGLIEKAASARDARVSLVALSGAGKTALEELEEAVNDAAQSMFGRLDAQQQQALGAMIKTLA